MRRIRRFFSIVLSLSMALTLLMPMAEAEAKGQRADARQAGGEIAVLEVNTGASEEALGQEEYIRIGASEEKTGVSLEQGDTVIGMRALDANGKALEAGKDFIVKSEEGKEINYILEDNGIVIHSDDILQDELKVCDASGNKVTTVVLVNKPEGINADGDTTVTPEVTGIELSLVSEDAALHTGEDGYLTSTGSQRYYYYDNAKIQKLYNVVVTYSDGTTYSETLYDAVRNAKVTCSANQSYSNPWKPEGKFNRITVRGGSVSKIVNVPVEGCFYEIWDGCPRLEEDAAVGVSYLRSDAKSGICLFRPERDGVYHFYSSGKADTCVWLYGEDGVSIAYDDDGYDDHNFLLSAELKEGKTYVLETYTYDKSDAAYKVTVTGKELPDFGYASLEGKDLSGKYINLALVVDTTGSMSGIIKKVKESLNKFVDMIAETKATLRISLIDYKDITSDGENTTVLHYSPSLSIWFENDDVEDLKKEIEALAVTGGGDIPESAVDALANLLEPDIMTFNMAAAKFAFLVTDASYKEENSHGIDNIKELMHKLTEKGIVTSVITKKDNYSYYRKLATVTDGVLINVDGDFTNSMGRIASRIVDETEDWEADPDIVPVMGVELGGDLSVPEGKIKNFRPSFNPANASEQGVVWKVEDENIAKVSPVTTNGILVVQGIQQGTTKIIARSLDGGYVASFDLTVQKTVVTDNKMESCDIDSILEELEKPELAEGETPVTELVYYGDAEPTVEAEKQKGIYSRIIRTDKSISYVFDDELGDLVYEWKFEGEGITDSDIAVDLEVAVNAENSRVKTAAIEKAGLDPYAIVDFSHSGDLPGTATVTVKVGEPFEDGIYELYYYNEDTGELELCEGVEVTVSGGMAVFPISHCSSYVIGKKHIPPTPVPTVEPTQEPTAEPTPVPTNEPTSEPTDVPTAAPTAVPTEKPTAVPTEKPTAAPTEKPTAVPTEKPTAAPTIVPTDVPTAAPTAVPTEKPTVAPTAVPTEKPTAVPTIKPTDVPTAKPAQTEAPKPTDVPEPAVNVPAKGARISDKTSFYTVTKAGKTGGTVTYAKPVKSKVTAVTVPDTVTIGGITYKVTAIAPNAFKNCKNLKRVTIGKNITSIGAKAFYKCKKLAKISIKAKKLTNKKVGNKAFTDIYKSAVINVPKNKRKAYEKLLRARGCGKKAKIK